MADPALSVMQPWAGLLVLGIKPIENRTWFTHHRGRVLIHAGRTLDTMALAALLRGLHPVTGDPLRVDLSHKAFKAGGIVGEANLVDCVAWSDSDWFVGPLGFVLADARPTPFRPCRGALGFFTPDFAKQYAPPPHRDAPHHGARYDA